MILFEFTFLKNRVKIEFRNKATIKRLEKNSKDDGFYFSFFLVIDLLFMNI
jgi:hypothetical protein